MIIRLDLDDEEVPTEMPLTQIQREAQYLAVLIPFIFALVAGCAAPPTLHSKSPDSTIFIHSWVRASHSFTLELDSQCGREGRDLGAELRRLAEQGLLKSSSGREGFTVTFWMSRLPFDSNFALFRVNGGEELTRVKFRAGYGSFDVMATDGLARLTFAKAIIPQSAKLWVEAHRDKYYPRGKVMQLYTREELWRVRRGCGPLLQDPHLLYDELYAAVWLLDGIHLHFVE